jgi:transcriptional regulator GlxA family with amidase domain
VRIDPANTFPKKIRFLVYSNANTLDLTGPLEVFGRASDLFDAEESAKRPTYEIELISIEGGIVTTSSGVGIQCKRADIEDIDTLIIAGSRDEQSAGHNLALIDWLKYQAPRTNRIGTLGSGAFMAAQAGLLSNRRATTHWRFCAALTQRFPDVKVLADTVFVVDGPYWTSAGGISGVDMALAMIECDLGAQAANTLSAELITGLRRNAGEAQLNLQTVASEAERNRIHKLMEWISHNPAAELSIEAMAEQAALSPRSLYRHFARESQLTPGEFVERVRVNEARRHLSRTDHALEKVAAIVGFTSLKAMRRAFLRITGMTPLEYRRSFLSEPRRVELPGI